MLAALGFGTSNYLSEDLSRRLGVKSVWAHTFGLILTWMAYHLVLYIKYKRKGREVPYFTKETSLYYLEFISED